MSILDFLTSVFNNVILLFSSWWYQVSFVVSTAYTSIYNYWVRLQYFLQTFADRYVYSTDWYHNRARSPLDYIGVFNFFKTTYTAIDSFPQQQEYNTQLRNPLADFVYNLSARVRTLATTFYDLVQRLYSVPGHVIDYITGIGAEVTRIYEQYERPTVRFLKGRQDSIDQLTEPTFLGRIKQLGQTLFQPITSLAGPYYYALVGMAQSAAKVARLTDDVIFPKIQETFTSDYGGLKGLLDVASNIIDLMTPEKKTKLDYLLDRGFDYLVTMAEEPKKSILDVIEDIFFTWFLDRLFNWLTETVD